MINYTPQSQLKLELFKHPFESELDKDNRWVKLAELIPWDSLAAVYSQNLDSKNGRKSVNVRTVIASLIIKHKIGLDDRGTIEMICENVYLQYFCGLPSFTTKPVFDPSLFVDIRKRMGGKAFDEFNKLVIRKSEEIKPHQARILQNQKQTGINGNSAGKPKREINTKEPKNKGRLKLDATVADQEVTFPTDLKLLNEARENLERIIDNLHNLYEKGQKPRTYRRNARKEFLNLAKKKNKSKKEWRSGIRGQLQYVKRNIKIVEKLLRNRNKNLIFSKRDRKLLLTIKEVYQQQLGMYKDKSHRCESRIVNLYQPHVRPIVRGKDKAKVEFGSKINVSEVEGFTRVNRFSWDAYNESTDLAVQVEGFKELYGCYPRILLADRIYLTRKNRAYLKEKNIEILGPPLGRRSEKNKPTTSQKQREKRENAKRNHVEGKFGQGKRRYGLNNIKAKLPETSESWVNAIFFVMNLTKLLQLAGKWPGSFLSFIKNVQIWLDKMKRLDYGLKYSTGLNTFCVSVV